MTMNESSKTFSREIGTSTLSINVSSLPRVAATALGHIFQLVPEQIVKPQNFAAQVALVLGQTCFVPDGLPPALFAVSDAWVFERRCSVYVIHKINRPGRGGPLLPTNWEVSQFLVDDVFAPVALVWVFGRAGLPGGTWGAAVRSV